MVADLLIGVIIIALISIVGLAGGSILWSKTRPKKKTWYANIYRLGDGITLQKDKHGNYTNLKIRDLIGTKKDIAEQIDKKPGITVYRLQKENKALPPITDSHVTYWENGRREVDILSYKGNFTLLTKGYDKESGDEIFKPIPVDDFNIMESNLAIKKERFKEKKDILEAISPFVTAIIIGLVITANTYLIVQGWKYNSDKFEEGTDRMASMLNQIGGYAENIESIRNTGKPITKEDSANLNNPPLIEDLG